MARFTNYATLSYNGGSTDSNTVTGELLEVLSASKTAVSEKYTARDRVTYVLALVNSGKTEFTGLTVTDDLGGYLFGENLIYPLAYLEGSLRTYINGVLQPAPAVTAEPPLLIEGVSVPAGGNIILIYETEVTEYAPLGVESVITNTATITGGGLSAPLTATETIGMESGANLSISKALCPATVTENGQLTYTFMIENSGNTEASEAESVVLSDTFNPKLKAITVTFNGTVWTEGVDYTYDADTGEFATIAGQIIVPPASYEQNENGTWTAKPGSATLTINGTV